MTQPFRRIWPLALAALLAAQAAAQEADGDEPAEEVGPDARLWKEPCDLDGKGRGELLRVSGSVAGANMSAGQESYRVNLGEDHLVELTQEGRLMLGGGAEIPEDERWAVACARGAIAVRSGGAELRLAVSGRKAAIDARWLRGLTPEGTTGISLEALRALRALLDGISDEPAVAGRAEASARIGLLLAERAIDAGETDEAELALRQAEADEVAALAGWSRRVAGRLAERRGEAPLSPGKPAKLGTLQERPTVPFGDATEGELDSQPGVFWLRDALCVRQEGARRGSMRCFDAARRRWGDEEPYVSPFVAGPTISAVYLGHAGDYATRLAVTEAGTEREVGRYRSPRILARDARGGLVVLSAGTTPEGSAAVAVEGYDAATGVGSTLAGGGRFFFDGPTALRSVAQLGRSWRVPAPGAGAGVACVTVPLTSPDETRAACLAARPGVERPSAYELWIFGLAPAPAKK